MTTELCGYGDKWRKRTGHLMEWIDSRDRHRFAQHRFSKKCCICSFSRSKHFSRCPSIQCSTYRALFVDALPSVLSISAREQPSSNLVRDWFWWFQRAFCPRSFEVGRAILLSPCQASRSRPSMTHEIAYNTPLSQSRTRFLTTSRFTLRKNWMATNKETMQSAILSRCGKTLPYHRKKRTFAGCERVGFQERSQSERPYF